MSKTIGAVGGTFLWCMILYGLIQWYHQEPKFHYKDKVKIVKGFNTGRTGTCMSTLYWMGYEYYIQVDDELPNVTVEEDEIELIKEHCD